MAPNPRCRFAAQGPGQCQRRRSFANPRGPSNSKPWTSLPCRMDCCRWRVAKSWSLISSRSMKFAGLVPGLSFWRSRGAAGREEGAYALSLGGDETSSHEYQQTREYRDEGKRPTQNGQQHGLTARGNAKGPHRNERGGFLVFRMGAAVKISATLVGESPGTAPATNRWTSFSGMGTMPTGALTKTAARAGI